MTMNEQPDHEHYMALALRWAARGHAEGGCPIGGVLVHKGTVVQMGIYEAHHHPKFWADPETFRPERFNETDNKRQHPFAFIPFSAGPRNCVGRNFALREALIILATLMQQFDVEQVVEGPDDNVRMEYVAIVEPVGLKIRFKLRAQ